MNTSMFIVALSISTVYLIFRFIEMRFILKENKPVKVLFRDTLIVYFSVLIGNFILSQVDIKSNKLNVSVFTDSPGF